MKWPSQLVLIRHAESAYNALKHQMQADPDYQQFKLLYAKNPLDAKTVDLAHILHERYPCQHGDMATPLANGGLEQSQKLGQFLRQNQAMPDLVYVSPYVRTWATLSGILQGWPELSEVKVIEEERIREQEFGLRLLYNDLAFFFALHPDQYQLHSLRGSYWYRYPQGENVPDVRARNRSWATTLTRDFAGKSVLAITHHLNILAFRANMERLSAHQFIDLDEHDKPANASATIYRGEPKLGRDGRLLLESYNLRATD